MGVPSRIPSLASISSDLLNLQARRSWLFNRQTLVSRFYSSTLQPSSAHRPREALQTRYRL